MQPTSEERWLPVPGWEGYYEVSDHGRLRSVERVVVRSDGRTRTVRSRILQPHSSTSGYKVATLTRHNRTTNTAVHRLVLEAFVGPCPEGMEGCHSNGVRDDNRLANLRWDSRKGNVADMLQHGTQNNQRKTHCPRGHVLAAPNLLRTGLPARRCLACARARNYVKHHGLVGQLQQCSDDHYREIMRWVIQAA